MDLSESPTCMCRLCGSSNTASSADLLVIQTAVMDRVVGLRSYSSFGFNCQYLMSCLHFCSYMLCYDWMPVLGLARTGLIFTGLQEGAQPGGGG